MSNESIMWHKRLRHASFSTINKLISKELVLGLPKGKVSEDQVCGTCAQGKHVKSSSQPVGMVSTHKPLKQVHMDLCGPMHVQSR